MNFQNLTTYSKAISKYEKKTLSFSLFNIILEFIIMVVVTCFSKCQTRSSAILIISTLQRKYEVSIFTKKNLENHISNLSPFRMSTSFIWANIASGIKRRMVFAFMRVRNFPNNKDEGVQLLGKVLGMICGPVSIDGEVRRQWTVSDIASNKSRNTWLLL